MAKNTRELYENGFKSGFDSHTRASPAKIHESWLKMVLGVVA